MMNEIQIQLKLSSVLNVPLEKYGEDFIFVVNNKEFKTSQLIADLISPTIRNIHITDPTFNEFIIQTKQEGDFSHILKLINFNLNEIPQNEIPFFIEIIENLGYESFNIIDPEYPRELTNDNIFSLIKHHEKYRIIYSKQLSSEIDFISSHFFELIQSTNREEIKNLDTNTIFSIFNNKNLQLEDEDQLMKIINELYSINSDYSILYETVIFSNLSAEMMNEFIQIFSFDDLTKSIYDKMCERMKHKVYKNHNSDITKRYIGKTFQYSEENKFSGIINYISKKNNGNVSNEINISASSYYLSDKLNPFYITLFENQTKGFVSENVEKSWICIDFKEHRIIPTGYSIKSIGKDVFTQAYFLKSWIIETSNDGIKWEKIHEEKESKLRGNSYVQQWKFENPPAKEIRYFRLHSFGQDWNNAHYIAIDSLEIFGTLK